MNTFKKYFRILRVFTKISLSQQLVYRFSFWFGVVTKILRVLLLIVMFDVLYNQTNQIAGWTHGEALLVLAIYLTMELLALSTFHRNLMYWWPSTIRTGEFDFYLTKPLAPLFHSMFRVIDVMDFFSGAAVLVVWYRALSLVSITWALPSVVWFVVFLGVAYVILLSLAVIISASVFWTTTRAGLGRLVESTTQAARFPLDIFPRSLQILFSTLFPIAFIATVPAKILLHRASAGLIGWGIIVAVVFFISAIKFWHFALRRYSSASS